MSPNLKNKIRQVVEASFKQDREGVLLGIRMTLAAETTWDLLGLPSTPVPTEDELRRAASLVAGMIEAVRNGDEAREARLRLLS